VAFGLAQDDKSFDGSTALTAGKLRTKSFFGFQCRIWSATGGSLRRRVFDFDARRELPLKIGFNCRIWRVKCGV